MHPTAVVRPEHGALNAPYGGVGVGQKNGGLNAPYGGVGSGVPASAGSGVPGSMPRPRQASHRLMQIAWWIECTLLICCAAEERCIECTLRRLCGRRMVHRMHPTLRGWCAAGATAVVRPNNYGGAILRPEHGGLNAPYGGCAAEERCIECTLRRGWLRSPGFSRIRRSLQHAAAEAGIPPANARCMVD
jgi:hypothetical protein